MRVLVSQTLQSAFNKNKPHTLLRKECTAEHCRIGTKYLVGEKAKRVPCLLDKVYQMQFSMCLCFPPHS